jgi:hypothetical protein
VDCGLILQACVGCLRRLRRRRGERRRLRLLLLLLLLLEAWRLRPHSAHAALRPGRGVDAAFS